MKKILILMSFILLSAEGAMAKNSNGYNCGKVSHSKISGVAPKSSEGTYTNYDISFTTKQELKFNKKHGRNSYYQVSYYIENIQLFPSKKPTPSPSTCGTTCTASNVACHCGSLHYCGPYNNQIYCTADVNSNNTPNCSKEYVVCSKGGTIPSELLAKMKTIKEKHKKSSKSSAPVDGGNISVTMPTNVMTRSMHHNCKDKTYGMMNTCWLEPKVTSSDGDSMVSFTLTCTVRGEKKSGTSRKMIIPTSN